MGYKLYADGLFKIGSVPILASKICFQPVNPPTVGVTRASYSPFGWWIFGANYTIDTKSWPTVKNIASSVVPISKPLNFSLDKPDGTFSYKLKINNASANCRSKSSVLSCDISKVGLKQGEKYKYKIQRYFKQQRLNDAFVGDFRLVEPINITNGSVRDNETIYSKPLAFTFETNKKISNAIINLQKIDSKNIATKISSSLKIDGSKLTISVSKDLARQTNYKLSIEKIVATDGSTLDSAKSFNFTTSGGPKVTSINIGNSIVSSNAKVVVTFDQPIAASQDVTKFASLSGGNSQMSRTENQIIFQLNNLPTCGAFSITINKGLLSQYGIQSTDGWSYASRTSCKRTVLIGYSVRGRPIYAYYFGNGSTTILFTGGIHGSELSGQYTMDGWVNYLDTYAYDIPSDRQVVVVPALNPDGLASASRYNANNVNLDRNFPTVNWQADISTGSGIVVNGGGTTPLSEPESRAISILTTNLRPRLEVSFHSQGSLVGANQSGDSTAIGNLYAASVGYKSMIGYAEEVMGYSMTGEYEDWMGEQYGIPAILIELPTSRGNYLQTNLSTLWKMVRI